MVRVIDGCHHYYNICILSSARRQRKRCRAAHQQWAKNGISSHPMYAIDNGRARWYPYLSSSSFPAGSSVIRYAMMREDLQMRCSNTRQPTQPTARIFPLLVFVFFEGQTAVPPARCIIVALLRCRGFPHPLPIPCPFHHRLVGKAEGIVHNESPHFLCRSVIVPLECACSVVCCR